MSTQVRFTLDEFDRMIDAAVFDPDRRIELIFGELREVSLIGECHRRVIVLLTEWAIDATAGLRDRLGVQVQNPLRLPSERSGPIPDMSWIDRECLQSSALPQDNVFLVIEVASSTLSFDRGQKARLYAAAGIPDYWVVNLIDDRVEVHRKSAGRPLSVAAHLSCRRGDSAAAVSRVPLARRPVVRMNGHVSPVHRVICG